MAASEAGVNEIIKDKFLEINVGLILSDCTVMNSVILSRFSVTLCEVTM